MRKIIDLCIALTIVIFMLASIMPSNAEVYYYGEQDSESPTYIVTTYDSDDRLCSYAVMDGLELSHAINDNVVTGAYIILNDGVVPVEWCWEHDYEVLIIMFADSDCAIQAFTFT